MAHGKNWRSWPFNIPGFLKTLYDAYTHALTFIEEEHRHVHDGMVFDVDHYAAAVADAGNLDIHFKVPAGIYPHLRSLQFALADSPCHIYLYEAPTLTGDGTPLTAINHNRNSANTASMEVFHTPTVSVVGTQLHRRFVPDTGGVGIHLQGVTGHAGSAQEFVLKPSTSYLLRITNNSGGPIPVGIEALWYELSYLNEEA